MSHPALMSAPPLSTSFGPPAAPSPRSRLRLAYVVPLLACVVWTTNLIVLGCLWRIADDGRKIMSTSASLPFISDAVHQAPFVALCVLTALLYVASLALERWMRSANRIPGLMRRRERVWDTAAIVCAVIAAVFLIMLSAFNDIDHPKARAPRRLWIVFSLASAVLQSTEAYGVSSSHPERKHLKRAARIKITFCCAAAGIASAFALTYQVCDGKVSPGDPSICNRVSTTCAVLEWLLALGFSGYLLTLVLDLWPANAHPSSVGADPEAMSSRPPAMSQPSTLPSGQTFQPTPSMLAAWQPQATLPPNQLGRSGVAFASQVEYAPGPRVFSTASSVK